MPTKATISIPERDREAVLTVFRLSAANRERILNAVETLEPAFEIASVMDQLVSKSGVDPEISRNTAQMLFNVYGISEYSGESIEFIADRLGEAVSDFSKGSKISSSQIDKVKAFIVSALSSGAFAISAKASRVMSKHDNTFIRSEVFSDIRAIFKSNDEVRSPEAAVIVHNLNIIHFNDDDSKSFYVSLDYNDLLSLKATIDRAIDKHGLLSRLIGNAGLNYLEPQGI